MNSSVLETMAMVVIAVAVIIGSLSFVVGAWMLLREFFVCYRIRRRARRDRGQ